jgi:hypothetical protein
MLDVIFLIYNQAYLDFNFNENNYKKKKIYIDR